MSTIINARRWDLLLTRKSLLSSFVSLIAAFVAFTTASSAEVIYVSNWNNRSVQKFDSVTGSSLGYIATDVVGSFRGIALGREGDLFAVLWGGQCVMKYGVNGSASVFAGDLGGSESVAFDRAGNLYVGNKWSNTIIKITPDGVRSVFASGLNEPDGLAFDKSGNLFVSNGAGNTIQKITPQGVSSIFATGLRYPYGLAFDDAGNLFVANFWGPYYGIPAVLKFTPAGVRSAFATTGLSYPTGLAFDRAGNLYVADMWGGPNGRIVKFTPAGAGSLFADISFAGPVGIAIQSLPKIVAPPSIVCPDPLLLECTNGSANTTLQVRVIDTNGLNLNVIWTVDGVPYQTNNVSSSGAVTDSSVTFTGSFGYGEHLIAVSVSNGQAAPVTCSTSVSVRDTAPPAIVGVSATPERLRPVNHRMVPVTVTVAAIDNCEPSPTAHITAVSSNEAQTGFAPDWEITGALTVNLRAERRGRGQGRVYTIFVESEDADGNKSSAAVDVLVPHDRK